MPKPKAVNNDVPKTAEAKKRRRKPKKNEDGVSDGKKVKMETYLTPGEEVEKIRLKGSTVAGELLFCGGTNWDLTGRSQVPKHARVPGSSPIGGRNLWSPHRLSALSGVRVKAVFSGPVACHTLLVTEEGKAMSWGRNDKEQLGHCDAIRRDTPTLIETLKDYTLVEAACGRNHTLCLTNEGEVFAFGENKFGQLGLGFQCEGNKDEKTSIGKPQKILYDGQPITRVACGGDFSMVVDLKGRLYSFGHPEYSQLGHDNDGQYFVTSKKVTFDCQLVPKRIQLYIERTREGQVKPLTGVLIKDVVCGVNHTVALDIQKRVFTWGFGGYGRLGHQGPKDEAVPRILKPFDMPNRGVKSIHGGSAYSMAVTEFGMLFFWGQAKTTGEATMYPKPVQDLNGWNIRSVGCSNRSIVIAADESLISWGPSPTYGELGYGENGPRSSTCAKEVKTVEGIFIHSVACGYGHTVMLARDDETEEKEKIQKLPVFTPTP
ncbi:protein RCC2-like isoform X2 [Anneissia japonica]|uniref:protein RCC2-like isoform X1 n=1 Tax=Anneissia japonica TaxID=1529436 RepID=UPI001425B338|nr:protein RCC2-like isoform X1 [Anneissia japonica]XP_033107650.1 protein RCC2-like isoform X2 [Anneissia japonica]